MSPVMSSHSGVCQINLCGVVIIWSATKTEGTGKVRSEKDYRKRLEGKLLNHMCKSMSHILIKDK